MKLLFCGTHPNLDSGYANVVYNLLLNICQTRLSSTEIVLFAFDAQATVLDRARDLPIRIISPHRINGEPFGDSILAETIDQEQPDVVIIYNDILVVNRLLNSLTKAKHQPKRKLVYLDLVYEYETRRLVDGILDRVDLVWLFANGWREHLRSYRPRATVTIKTLHHGLRCDVLSQLNEGAVVSARQQLGLPDRGVIVLNLNRNSGRKRWDITVCAFVALLAKIEPWSRDMEPVYLYVGCVLQRDNPNVTYNLMELIETECTLQGVDAHQALDYFIFKGNQHLSDREVNLLYNCCDIGLNTCSGEGFGLCNFEHGYLGKPQVVPRVGGLKSCLEGAYFVEPLNHSYSLEGVGGLAYDYDYRDFTRGLELYYRSLERRVRDGQCIRERIESCDHHRWEQIAQQFLDDIGESIPASK